MHGLTTINNQSPGGSFGSIKHQWTKTATNIGIATSVAGR